MCLYSLGIYYIPSYKLLFFIYKSIMNTAPISLSISLKNVFWFFSLITLSHHDKPTMFGELAGELEVMLETTLLTFLTYECSIFPMSISTHMHTHVCVCMSVWVCVQKNLTHIKNYLSKTKQIITSDGIGITDILFLACFCLL